MWWILLLLVIACALTGVVTTNNRPKCEQCGSCDVGSGSYTRGFNHLCGQAHGSYGHYCNHITYTVPDEDYVNTLPKWCDHKLRLIDPLYAKELAEL